MLQAWVGGGIEQSVLTSQMEDNNAQNPESHEREQQLLQGESKGTREKRKKRWGAEKVEALTLLEQHHQQGEPAGSQQTTPDASSQQQQVEPAQKKRRSRWEEPAPPQAIICSSGMPIQLPQSLAHLIDINPESLELNRQLNVVSYVLGLVKMNVSRFAGRTSFISFHALLQARSATTSPMRRLFLPFGSPVSPQTGEPKASKPGARPFSRGLPAGGPAVAVT